MIANSNLAQRNDETLQEMKAGAGQTVLVVDDEATIRMLIAEVLEDLGHVAIEAENGAAGLGVIQADVKIDLLITDVGLPGGINGRQLADAGQAIYPSLKVLFITGYAESAADDSGNLAPGMQVLSKPFIVDDLVQKIMEITETRLTPI